MQLALKGRKTTYHAGYKANAHGDNTGIGLWTDNHTTGDIQDIAYLWPDADENDILVIDIEAAIKQGIQIVMQTKNGPVDIRQLFDRKE
jgi:hypothetical protein